MDLITLSATAAAAQTAAEAAGGGGGGGPTPPPAIPERTDEHYANTVLLLHGDGNPGANNVNNPAPIAQYIALSDDSPNDRSVNTVGGNVYGTDFNPFYYNAGVFSNHFDGSGDYLITPSNASFGFGTGDFAIEFWTYVVSTSNTPYFLDGRSTSTANEAVPVLYINSGNYEYWVSGAARINGGAVPLNQWVHVAVVRSSGTTTLYSNGVSVGTWSDSTNYTTTAFVIGQRKDTAGQSLTGNISNFRVVKGTAVYTSAFTPPTAPFEDPTTHGELSVYFDGTGDGLNAGTDARFLPVANEDFTFEAWVYLTATPGAQGAQIMGVQEYGTSSDWISYVGSDLVPDLWIQAASSGAGVTYAGSTAIKLNEWTHIAWSRSGTGSNNMKLFINGVQDAQHTYTGTMKYSGTTGLTLGSDGAFDESLLTGYISNARIIKGTGLYTTGFTPPSALTAVANTTFLSCQGKTFQDYSSTNAPIARGGNARISEFGPFGDGYWSVGLDGGDNRITIADDNSLDLGSNDFTVEAWVYMASYDSSGFNSFIHKGGSSTNSYHLDYKNGTTQLRFLMYVSNSADTNLVGTTTLSLNTWYHIAAVRNGTSWALYKDGTSVATYTSSLTIDNTTNAIGIGRRPGFNDRRLNGYISNVRIVNGTNGAVYTSNFTPSTSPLTAVTDTALLTCQSNRFIDNSSNGHDVTTPVGTPEIDEFIPFEYLQRQTKLITCQENRFKDIINYRHLVTPSGESKVSTLSPFSSNASYKTANTGAIYMDGTSFVTIDDQAESFKFGTEDYTMEAWVYDTSTDSTQRTIFGRNGTGNLSIPYVYRVGTSDVLSLYYSSGVVSSTRKIYKGEWTHLALCRENGTSRLFINGELQGSAADTTNIVTPVKLVIGNNGGSSSNLGWIGYFYGVRVEKGRAKYTSNASFNPASTQPALANSANTGAISTNQFSNFFDGTADYIANTNVMPLSDYAFGINDWTIEGWINLNKSTNHNIFDPRQSGVQGVYPMIWVNGSSQLSFWRSTANRITSRALSVGKWYHFAFVRSGGTTKLYLDGLQEGADYADTGDYLAQRIIIGMNANGSSYPYYGWLHSLNVLNGVAKYTSNTAITYSPVSTTGTQLATGYSWDFNRGVANGTYPYYSILGESDFVVGTNDFTIEAWIYIDDLSASAQIATQRAQPTTVAATVYPHFLFNVNSSGQLQLQTRNTSGTQFFARSAAGTIKEKVWYHVVGTRASGALKVYINGVHHSHETANDSAFNLTEDDFCVGGFRVTSFSNRFAGNIHSLRFIIGTALYTSNFTPSTEPLTTTSQGATASEVKFLGCQNDTFINNATNNIQGSGFNGSTSTGTLVNTSGPGVSTFNPFDNGYWSTHFDGTGDRIVVPSQATGNSEFTIGANEFCYEFWIKNEVTGATLVDLLEGRTTTTGVAYYDGLTILLGGDNNRQIQLVDGNDDSVIVESSTQVDTSKWFHIVMTRDSSNYVRVFVDGNLEDYQLESGSFDYTPVLGFGCRVSDAYYGFLGKLSNFRLTIGSIPTNYATSETSANTQVFTPPTTPITSVTDYGATADDVKSILFTDGSFIDRSTANSGIGWNVVNVNDVTVSRTRPFSTELARDQVLLACQDKEVIKDNSHLDTKFTKTGDVTRSADNPFDDGFWSADFDGNGDYLIANLPSGGFGTGDFTIEYWIKQDTLTDWQTHIATTRGGAGFNTGTDASGDFVWYSSGARQIEVIGAITTNRWYHWAFVRESGTVRGYVDGTQVASASITTNFTDTTLHIGALNPAGEYTNGKISNLRIVIGSAVYTSNFTPSTSPFTTTSQGATASEVKLLTCQSSNFADNSNTLTKITASGNANTRPVFPDTFANTIPQQTTFLAGKYRGSVRNVGFLDESSNNSVVETHGTSTQGSFTPFYPPSGYWSFYIPTDDVEFTSNSGFNILDYSTLECWVYFNSLGSNILIIGREANYWLGYNYTGIGGASNKFVFSIANASTWGGYVSSTTTPVAGQWYHILGVYENTTLRIYINGTQENTSTFSGTLRNSAYNFGVGGYNGGSETMNGYISNARLVTGASSAIFPYSGLTSGSSFTVPTTPLTSVSGTQILTAASNRFVDLNTDTTAKTFSNVNGTPRVEPFFPFDLTTSYDAYDHGGSAWFDGVDDRLEIQRMDKSDLLARDFTFECWYYATYTGSARNGALFSQGNSGVYAPMNVYQYGDGMRFNHSSTGSSWDVLADSTTYGSGKGPLFSWNHIAVCRSGSTISAYLNGERVHTLTTSASLFKTTQPTCIGNRPDNAVDYEGYIGSWRWITDETIYDPSQTSLTVPTEPFRQNVSDGYSNTAIQFNFTNAGIYDSTAKTIFYTGGNAQISTGAANTKFGTGSLYFDGTGDYLETPVRPHLVFGSGDVTVEAFVKPMTSPATATIIDTRVAAGSYGSEAFSFYISSGNLQAWAGAYSSSSVLRQGGAVPTGTWSHVAFVRENGTNMLFINGQKSGADNSTAWTQTFNSAVKWRIGDSIGYARGFNGYIDELRITVGQARYSANFTPMTAASGNKSS